MLCGEEGLEFRNLLSPPADESVEQQRRESAFEWIQPVDPLAIVEEAGGDFASLGHQVAGIESEER